MDNTGGRTNDHGWAVYLRRTMRKTTIAKARTRSSKKRVVRRKPKAKVFDAWHLYGSLPGIADEALAELKRMRDEW